MEQDSRVQRFENPSEFSKPDREDEFPQGPTARQFSPAFLGSQFVSVPPATISTGHHAWRMRDYSTGPMWDFSD